VPGCHVPTRDRAAAEIRAVAPLITCEPTPRLVGTVTVVANGDRVIGVTSAELLRPLQGTPLQLVTRLDGTATVPITSYGMGRYMGLAIVELEDTIPDGHDVVPLPISAVHATVNTHGAPSVLVLITFEDGAYRRKVIDIDVDADDVGQSDHVVYLAIPIDPAHAGLAVEGAPAFGWLPPDPVLRRPSEVVVFAIAYPHRARHAKPHGLPVFAELVGLDDLGRALLVAAPTPADDRPKIVTGEIGD